MSTLRTPTRVSHRESIDVHLVQLVPRLSKVPIVYYRVFRAVTFVVSAFVAVAFFAARRVGPKGRVFSFEPDPMTFESLSRSLNSAQSRVRTA